MCSNLTDKQLKQLEVLKRKLLGRSSGPMNSSPNIFVYSESGEYSVSFSKEFIIAKYVLKDEVTSDHIAHSYKLDIFSYKLDILDFYTDHQRRRSRTCINKKTNV